MKTHEQIQNKLSHSLETLMGDTETIESFTTLMETMGVYEELGYSMEKFREKHKEYLEDLRMVYGNKCISNYNQ